MTTKQTARELVKRFRQSRGWTQEQAAQWWGCEANSWSQYERGVRRVPRPLLLTIQQEDDG